MGILNKARAMAVLTLMSRGRSFEEVSIGEIPTEWEHFPNSNDLWKRVDLPLDENTSACLYQGYSGSQFNPHKHLNNVEHFVILNKGGKVEVITESEIKVIRFPNAVFFEMDEAHAVRFLTDTKILCMWHPAMTKGWEAEFINNNDTHITPAP